MFFLYLNIAVTSIDRNDILFSSTPNNTRSNGHTLSYPSSSKPSTPNCRNILSYRHLKIWNDLDASVVKSIPLCTF